ncbi:hypothetical protein PBY51_010282 [Eleginops maclovinus]|uniref:Uncharacterized protein n=1 Tax=Eleginops maclovinus TaxID=56733 RepID=A0AAN7X3L6_ELEMC|nr:hypothetical protein PBY51_010282 [Eleginops maclovinus]
MTGSVNRPRSFSEASLQICPPTPSLYPLPVLITPPPPGHTAREFSAATEDSPAVPPHSPSPSIYAPLPHRIYFRTP